MSKKDESGKLVVLLFLIAIVIFVATSISGCSATRKVERIEMVPIDEPGGMETVLPPPGLLGIPRVPKYEKPPQNIWTDEMWRSTITNI